MDWLWWALLNRQETSSKLQPSNLQNLGLATPKHHATEGRTRPSACRCLWTLLSEPDKKLAPNCSFQASKTFASPHRNTTQLKDGSGLRPAATCAERCFVNRQETSCRFCSCHCFLPPSCSCSSPFLPLLPGAGQPNQV